MFLLVPAYPGCPGSKAVKRSLLLLLFGTTQMSRYQQGKTKLDFTEARDSEWHRHQLGHMQVCTSLQTDNHASTPPLSCFTGRMPFLPPNQQRHSTEGVPSVYLYYCTTFDYLILVYIISEVLFTCYISITHRMRLSSVAQLMRTRCGSYTYTTSLTSYSYLDFCSTYCITD